MRDTWVGASPTRAELEELLGHDAELISVVFEESIAETLDRYVDDERIKHALFGQGVIGAFAGPRDPGTASVRLMHHQGDLLGRGSFWGYVEGGMGRVSFAIAQAALESGATLATGVPVARILPGEGVEVESGQLLRAPVVVSNADPKRTLAMLDGGAVPAAFRRRIEDWRMDSPVVKLNAGLRRLPTFTAAAGMDPHRAMISITPGLDAAQEAAEACRRGEPSIGFAELYFQTAYDPSVAPPGRHTMSVFAQYAPYELAEGDWESRRSEIGELDPRRDRRLRPRRPRLRRAPGGPRAARHRAADRPHRRAHLPGRGAARPDVGPAAGPQDAGRGALSVRRGHAPGRLGDRPQRAKRGDGRARRRALTADARPLRRHVEHRAVRAEVEHSRRPDRWTPRPSCRGRGRRAPAGAAWPRSPRRTASLPRCWPAPSTSTCPRGGEWTASTHSSGHASSFCGGLVLGEVEAPVPGSDRDARAQAEEGDPVDLRLLSVQDDRLLPIRAGLAQGLLGLVVAGDHDGRHLDPPQRVDRLLEARVHRGEVADPDHDVHVGAALHQALRLARRRCAGR